MLSAAAASQPEPSADEDPRAPRFLPLRTLERHIIEARLNAFDGNGTKAAESLGISTWVLRARLQSYRRARGNGAH